MLLQAQTLAEQAIDAREKAEKGRQKAGEAERDVEAALIVKQKLEADIEKLRHISSEPPAERPSGERLRPDQTVDLGTSTQGVPTDEQNLDTELKGKLEQLHEVQKTIDEVETKVRPDLSSPMDALAYRLLTWVQADCHVLVFQSCTFQIAQQLLCVLQLYYDVQQRISCHSCSQPHRFACTVQLHCATCQGMFQHSCFCTC